ncbi:MAG: hypothetical protein E7315_02955 [Clostridiales bacterium]|nr:hypothetical protein [Clostridiales bacterium]
MYSDKESIQALILRSVQSGEISKKIKVISPSVGIVRIYVPGASKLNSSMLSLTIPLTIADMDVKQTSSGYILTGGEQKISFSSINSSYEVLLITTHLIRFTEKLENIFEDWRGIYSQLYITLYYLNEAASSGDIAAAKKYIVIHYLNMLLLFNSGLRRTKYDKLTQWLNDYQELDVKSRIELDIPNELVNTLQGYIFNEFCVLFNIKIVF